LNSLPLRIVYYHEDDADHVWAGDIGIVDFNRLIRA